MQKWIISIINHFWWCCSSLKGSVQELKEKWVSLLYHISNVHNIEENEIYKRFEHGKLSVEESRSKKWIDIFSPAYDALKAVVLVRGLMFFLKPH